MWSTLDKKILFLSHRWNCQRLKKHSSDYMMGLGFKRLGWDVSYYDYRDNTKLIGIRAIQEDIYKKIMEIRPDVLFINKGEKIDPNTIKRVKRDGFKGVIVGWYQDARKDPVNCVIDIQRECDVFFHCKGGERSKEYERLSKTPSFFLFAPYEPTFTKESIFNKRTINVSWFGQIYNSNKGYDNLREDILPKIKNNLDVYYACFGKKFIRGSDYYQALGRSKVSVNIPAIDMEYYFSNRLSHIMGSRCVPITYRFKGYDDIFSEGENCLSFNSPDEFVNVLNNNIDNMEDISKESYKFAEEYMCSNQVAKEILYVIENRKNSYYFMREK